jgi:hypothetical protein
MHRKLASEGSITCSVGRCERTSRSSGFVAPGWFTFGRDTRVTVWFLCLTMSRMYVEHDCVSCVRIKSTLFQYTSRHKHTHFLAFALSSDHMNSGICTAHSDEHNRRICVSHSRAGRLAGMMRISEWHTSRASEDTRSSCQHRPIKPSQLAACTSYVRTYVSTYVRTYLKTWDKQQRTWGVAPRLARNVCATGKHGGSRKHVRGARSPGRACLREEEKRRSVRMHGH